MTWQLCVASRAQRELERIPAKDQRRILAALKAMRENPLSGAIARLRNQPATWRRRVGSYRVFFDLHPDSRTVDVLEIVRRTSKTY